jgi:hypothetical protein
MEEWKMEEWKQAIKRKIETVAVVLLTFHISRLTSHVSHFTLHKKKSLATITLQGSK